ncbi:MAG TPA: choice-of-anchor tandem repeat GloVer-containing protein [Rhizomicrobium sp.]|jgi:uncharacterized repeat protein (TIGR03803 family)
MSRILNLIALSLAGMAFMLCAASGHAAPKKTKFTVLYSFEGNSTSGGSPFSSMIQDKAGNFYGTTTTGGTVGVGTVFKLAPDGTETVLHAFSDGSEGGIPFGGLVADSKGNLYGTTYSGGQPSCNCGVVFKVDTAGNESVLHTFLGGTDGATPYDTLILDKQGNLYGTTTEGGGACNCGIVFKLSPKGKLTVLHVFAEGSDGAFPFAGVTLDGQGNLFGATYQGGGTCDCGTIYKIDSAGNESVLYAFTGNSIDAAYPEASLLMDKKGNLFGTTKFGGTSNGGTVFRLAPDLTETILHSFGAGSDGATAYAGVVADKKGDLYGTTINGGGHGVGMVFKLAPNGDETVLYNFANGNDGANPYGGLILGKKNAVYGTSAAAGVNGFGTVFEIR